MPKKTWFQHDMNCRQKDGLSMLIRIGKTAAYGRFWILQELYMQSTYHKNEQNYFKSTEDILCKELHLKPKTLLLYLELLSTTCGVHYEFVSTSFSGLSHNQVIITLPNSLIYMTNRNQKNDNKSKKENKKEIKEKNIRFVFSPPSIEQVSEYCKERNNGINPQKWVDFYLSKGWMVGKNKMKDWKAAIRTWEKPNDGSGFQMEGAQ